MICAYAAVKEDVHSTQNRFLKCRCSAKAAARGKIRDFIRLDLTHWMKILNALHIIARQCADQSSDKPILRPIE
jgi:hypothetical protein